jgi:DNA processing protein
MNDVVEQASVLALVKGAGEGERWHQVATLIEEAGSAARLVAREPEALDALTEDSLRARAEALSRGVKPGAVDENVALIETLESQGIHLTTVLDDDYPANLREIHNRPPFLFLKGRLAVDDSRSVAVVGSREASQAGLSKAGSIAGELASRGVTVLSGLARGIDTAAHTASLDAGGRTVAVMGTGIRRIYPAENAELAQRILDAGGALVSQFWPDASPSKTSFPMRNVVMSGMAIGTVVVEASSTSGAKMQARLALQHGKRLFLVEDLVDREEWAQRYAVRPGTTVVRSVDDILVVLEQEVAAGAQQLSFL